MRKIEIYPIFILILFVVFTDNAHAERKMLTYADLVQQNIELREKIQKEKQKYTVLENERKVLILHVRRLQRSEQENLLEKNKDFDKKVQEMEQQLKAEKVKVKEKSISIKMLNQENKELSEKNQSLEMYLAKQKETFEQRKIENQDLKSNLQKVKNELSSIQTEFQDREEKLKIEKENFKENLERVMVEAKSYKEKVEELEQQLLVTQAREQELDKELQMRFSAQIQQEEQIEELKIDKFSTEARLAKQEEKMVEKAQEIAEKKISEIEQKTDRERIDMHYNLAVVFDKNGMYEDSEREYLKCLRIDPEDADVHYNLAILYDDKLNKNLAAIRHYKKYLELRPKGEGAAQVRQWMLLAEQEDRIGAETR